MLKLKYVTDKSPSIKYGSFETWILDVISIVKDVGAEIAPPSYCVLEELPPSLKVVSLAVSQSKKGKQKLKSHVQVNLNIK